MKSRKKEKTNWILIIAMIIYVGLNVVGIIYHEKWLDEAQIWLIAKNLSPMEIVRQMHYELSPSLWHQILHIFAASNWPYITQSIINSIIMVGTTYILFWRTKLPMPIKILLAFSYFWAFEYALISKSYSLTILFLMIIAAIRQNKNKNKNLWWQAVFVFLLANTNTIGMISAVAFMALIIWELIEKKENKIKNYLPLILMFGGMATAIWQIYPVADINHGNNFFTFTHYLTPINGWSMAFVPWKILAIDNLLLVREGIWHFSKWNALIVFVFGGLTIWRFYEQPKILVFLLTNYLGLSYLLIFRDNGHLRHYGFFLVWLIIALISDYRKNKQQKIAEKVFGAALIISLIFLNICNIKEYYMEIKYPFSPTKEAAQFIKQNNLENNYWVTDSFYMTSLLPYFQDKKIRQVACNQEISYFQVNRDCISGLGKNDENLKNIVKKKMIENQSVIFFTNNPLTGKKSENWKLLYQNHQYVFGYDYPTIFIYQYYQ